MGRLWVASRSLRRLEGHWDADDRRVWQRGNDAVPVRRDHAPGAELPQTARSDDNVHLNGVWSPDKTLRMYPGSYHSLHRGIGKQGVWVDIAASIDARTGKAP